VRGQYAAGVIKSSNNNAGKSSRDEKAAGYLAEQGVAPDSQTETFAALKFNIENWRWAGVPFYIRAGKRLSHHETQVVVHFKRTPQSLFIKRRGQMSNVNAIEVEGVEPNTVTLRIQPDEGISINFAAKIPGVEMRTGKVEMEFDYSETFGFASPAAYETLLLDAMQGDNTLFTRSDEIESQWRLITPIEEAWHNKKNAPPLETYAAGTSGPDAADKLLARHDHIWTPLTGHAESDKNSEGNERGN